LEITSEGFLQLGLKNDKIVSIKEVPNGLACECVCPKCKVPLIARNNGKLRQAHFAHQNNHACIGSIESAIHLLAKEILFEEKELFIPSYEKYFKIKPGYVELIKCNKSLKFDLVFYEQLFTYVTEFIKVDAVCIKSGKPLLIEFAHTHFVDDNKLRILKFLGHPCLEIDLANASQIKEELKLQLKRNFFKTTWLVNEKGELKAKEYGDILSRQKEKEENDLKKQKLPEKITIPNFLIQARKKNYEQLKREAEAKGTIVSKCPGREELYVQYAGTKYGNNDLIKKLLKGDWNGNIYEYKPNHFDLFIDEKRYFIFPENYNDLSDSEKVKCQELYNLVLRFKKYKADFFHFPCPCDYCNLFRGFFYNENNSRYRKAQIICGYKKGMKLEEHFIFPPKQNN
jgi:hypothetical protein